MYNNSNIKSKILENINKEKKKIFKLKWLIDKNNKDNITTQIFFNKNKPKDKSIISKNDDKNKFKTISYDKNINNYKYFKKFLYNNRFNNYNNIYTSNSIDLFKEKNYIKLSNITKLCSDLDKAKTKHKIKSDITAFSNKFNSTNKILNNNKSILKLSKNTKDIKDNLESYRFNFPNINNLSLLKLIDKNSNNKKERFKILLNEQEKALLKKTVYKGIKNSFYLNNIRQLSCNNFNTNSLNRPHNYISEYKVNILKDKIYKQQKLKDIVTSKQKTILIKDNPEFENEINLIS